MELNVVCSACQRVTFIFFETINICARQRLNLSYFVRAFIGAGPRMLCWRVQWTKRAKSSGWKFRTEGWEEGGGAPRPSRWTRHFAGKNSLLPWCFTLLFIVANSKTIGVSSQYRHSHSLISAALDAVFVFYGLYLLHEAIIPSLYVVRDRSITRCLFRHGMFRRNPPSDSFLFLCLSSK